uniref:Uncharacterized protein n=1 Tax=Glossina austeni TaxID=7395 RepID=A0A1A9UCM9_GLOAU
MESVHELVLIPNNKGTAVAARDALAKHIYANVLARLYVLVEYVSQFYRALLEHCCREWLELLHESYTGLKVIFIWTVRVDLMRYIKLSITTVMYSQRGELQEISGSIGSRMVSSSAFNCWTTLTTSFVSEEETLAVDIVLLDSSSEPICTAVIKNFVVPLPKLFVLISSSSTDFSCFFSKLHFSSSLPSLSNFSLSRDFSRFSLLFEEVFSM